MNQQEIETTVKRLESEIETLKGLRIESVILRVEANEKSSKRMGFLIIFASVVLILNLIVMAIILLKVLGWI